MFPSIGGILAVGILALSNVFKGIILQHYIHESLKGIMLTQNILGQVIYKKSLKVSKDGMRQTSVGDVVNHLGNDAARIGDAYWAAVEIAYAVVAFFAVSIIAYGYLSWAAIIGISTLFVLTPVMRMITKRFLAVDHELMERRDQRVNMISQVFNGIRVAKYFVWEKKLNQEIRSKREEELESQRSLAKTVSISNLIFVGTNPLPV